MGLSENVVYPIVPNGFADHYPAFKWLAISLGILTQHFQILPVSPWFPKKPRLQESCRICQAWIGWKDWRSGFFRGRGKGGVRLAGRISMG